MPAGISQFHCCRPRDGQCDPTTCSNPPVWGQPTPRTGQREGHQGRGQARLLAHCSDTQLSKPAAICPRLGGSFHGSRCLKHTAEPELPRAGARPGRAARGPHRRYPITQISTQTNQALEACSDKWLCRFVSAGTRKSKAC